MMLVFGRGIGEGRRIALLTVVGMVLVAGVVMVGLGAQLLWGTSPSPARLRSP